MNMTKAAAASTQAVSPVLIFTCSPSWHVPPMEHPGKIAVRSTTGQEHDRGPLPSGRGKAKDGPGGLRGRARW